MADSSDIEWTDATWNPVAGCSILSSGCTNCYALRMAARLSAMGQHKYQVTTQQSGGRAVWTGVIHLDENALSIPGSWHKPRRIFVNSMSDLFHPGVPDSFLTQVWAVMAEASHHTFQILTKRPGRMAAATADLGLPVLPNVWLGASVEDAEHLERIAELRAVAAKVRFISFEPLLGPMENIRLDGIDWAIVGGESGPNARPVEQVWVDAVRRACEEQGVAFFFKQWGGRNKRTSGRMLHGRTWDQFPPGSPC